MQSRFGVGQPGADLVAAQDQRHPVVDAVHRGIGRGGQNHKPIGPIDDLAEKCDVSTQTIKLIEAGRRNFKIKTLYTIATL